EIGLERACDRAGSTALGTVERPAAQLAAFPPDPAPARRRRVRRERRVGPPHLAVGAGDEHPRARLLDHRDELATLALEHAHLALEGAQPAVLLLRFAIGTVGHGVLGDALAAR